MDMRLNVAVAAAGGHLLRETLDQVESKFVEVGRVALESETFSAWQTFLSSLL